MAPTTTDLPITADTRVSVIEGLVHKLHAYYVLPDVATEIDTFIRGRLSDGAYDDTTTAAAFCDALTDDLRAISHDPHLSVEYSSEAQPPREKVADDHTVGEAWRLAVTVKNFDVRKVEWLPGNIGYLDLRSFEEPSYAAETYAAAMNLLAHTSALIIDLRHNGGGSPWMAAFLASYLFEEPVHLHDLFWRRGDATRPDGSTQQIWTLPYVPGIRYGVKPVYVLTGPDTFSSAEMFADGLQQLKRATLIGGITRGGGHPGDEYQIDQHFKVFIPTGRGINPITGTSFEAVGVRPDIEVPPETALEVAYTLGLEQVLEAIGDHPIEPLHLAAKQEVQKALNKRNQT